MHKDLSRRALRLPVLPIAALALCSCLAAQAAVRQMAVRAADYEEALGLAKTNGSDIAVLQRGSDWNRLGEMLHDEVWAQDAFARELGSGFILVTVDLPEQEGAPALRGRQPAEADSAPLRLAKLSGDESPLPSNGITAVEAKEGSLFKQRADGAWLAEGANPAQETLELRIKAGDDGQVLRLDFPTDPSLPGNGPGRAGNGNFALSEVEVLQGEAPLKLTAAWADASEAAWGAWNTVDGVTNQADSVWNAAGHLHRRRTLLLALEKPVRSGATVTVRLICRSPWSQHAPGCVRGAVVRDNGLAGDIVQVSAAQRLRQKNNRFSWWDTTYCPRIALLDREGRAVACENKPRLGLTAATLAARVRELRALREQRDTLWAQAEAAQGPERAELLRQSLALLGFANWAGNENGYKPIHDKIRTADPKDESGAVRWLGFGGDPRHGVPWTEPSWAKALEKKELTDADFEEALARIERELKDPRNRVLDHERIQRIMIARYLVYARWPKHEEQRFDVQRQIAAFDPDTFWGIGARGELGLHFRSATPMLTYGWATNQVRSGLNVWDMGDTAYFFDHAGPYTVRLAHAGGNDALKIRRIALLDGLTVLAEAGPEAELGPTNKSVEVALDFAAWRADRKAVLRVEAEAADGHTDIRGSFTVEPQLRPLEDGSKATETERVRAQRELEALRERLGRELAGEAARGDAGIARILESPAQRTSLAQAELMRVCGTGTLAGIRTRAGGPAFVKSFLNDASWVESFLASDKAEWPQALENLYVLHRYGAGLEPPLHRRLATALALQWGSGSRYRLVNRYRQVLQARQDGLLHVSFEDLDVRGLRWAVPTYGTAKDFQFLLDDRQTRLRDYLGAHGGVWYVSFNVYGCSVQDQWNYIAPWAHVYGTGTGNRPFPAHRQVGGVCGTVSTYGSATAQAHGIPSTAIGQPGHCAYIVRVGREWPVGNSVTWTSYASAPGWDGTGYPTLHRLYEQVNQDREHFMAATRLGWLARLQADRGAPGAGDWMKTYERAIAAQPANFDLWLDYVKRLEAVKELPSAAWLELARRASRDLAVAHEAAWAIVRRCLDKGLPGLKPAERMEVLLACNRELRQEKWVKPDGFPYDGILNWQVDSLGDPALATGYYGKLLSIHHSAKPEDNWIFGSILGWGPNRFSANPATASGYAQAMDGFFASQGEAMDKNQLTTSLTAGIRKAAEAGDLVSYRLWRDMAAKMLPPLKPEDVHLNAAQAAAVPKYDPFPGDLLSKDGLLQTSSACPSDKPLSYAQVLGGGFGGWFDTNAEEKPWAQVQLPGEGELSGIVLLNRYEYAPTEAEFQWAAPLKISVSLDGKTWSEVGSFAKADAVFRVDLAGKGIKARFVRIERTPGADKSQAPGRFHFRNFLVYGTKFY
jgi:hypothetical protein